MQNLIKWFKSDHIRQKLSILKIGMARAPMRDEFPNRSAKSSHRVGDARQGEAKADGVMHLVAGANVFEKNLLQKFWVRAQLFSFGILIVYPSIRPVILPIVQIRQVVNNLFI